MQRHGTGSVVLATSEAEFIRRLTGADLPSVVTPAELDACLNQTLAQWGESPRVDQQIVIAMIADMANEARSLVNN